MKRNTKGFSLVELSIVLVILGLLVGGILAGKSLIRASELRSISADLQRYLAASYSFRDKYFQIPGDMNNATGIWGYTGGTGCTNRTATAVTTPGTCDGSGDGVMDYSGAATQTGENFQFWRHLALAGLIEGSYSGNAGAAGTRDAVLGTNAPKARISNAGYGVEWAGDRSADPYFWNGSYRAPIYIGSQASNLPPTGNIFKTEEAWNIDSKIDDGKPATGKLRPHRKNLLANCTTTDVEATTAYNLSDTAISCNLMLITGF